MRNDRSPWASGLSAMALLSTAWAGSATAEAVLRPACNVHVKVYDSVRYTLVPAGTTFYTCPDEASEIDRRIKIPAEPRLIGEFGEWYEYEFRKGIPVYARKIAAGGKSSPGGAGSATLGTAVPASPTQLPAPPNGVEFERTNQPCVIPALAVLGFDANLYVSEDFAISDHAKVRDALLYGAAGVRALCGAEASLVKVKIYPVRYKSKVDKSSGVVRGEGGVGDAEWAYGALRYDRSSGQYKEVSDYYRNFEANRRERCAPLAAFFKRNGVQEVVDVVDLQANPFVYDGKVVAVRAYFAEMISRSEGMFGSQFRQGGELVVTNVPTTRFQSNNKVVLVGRVNGIRKQLMPMGGAVNMPQLAFVDAYEDEFEDTDVKPALGDAMRQ